MISCNKHSKPEFVYRVNSFHKPQTNASLWRDNLPAGSGMPRFKKRRGFKIGAVHEPDCKGAVRVLEHQIILPIAIGIGDSGGTPGKSNLAPVQRE